MRYCYYTSCCISSFFDTEVKHSLSQKINSLCFDSSFFLYILEQTSVWLEDPAEGVGHQRTAVDGGEGSAAQEGGRVGAFTAGGQPVRDGHRKGLPTGQVSNLYKSNSNDNNNSNNNNKVRFMDLPAHS